MWTYSFLAAFNGLFVVKEVFFFTLSGVGFIDLVYQYDEVLSYQADGVFYKSSVFEFDF